jgi:hypothetical protein
MGKMAGYRSLRRQRIFSSDLARLTDPKSQKGHVNDRKYFARICPRSTLSSPAFLFVATFDPADFKVAVVTSWNAAYNQLGKINWNEGPEKGIGGEFS